MPQRKRLGDPQTESRDTSMQEKSGGHDEIPFKDIYRSHKIKITSYTKLPKDTRNTNSKTYPWCLGTMTLCIQQNLRKSVSAKSLFDNHGLRELREESRFASSPTGRHTTRNNKCNFIKKTSSASSLYRW